MSHTGSRIDAGAEAAEAGRGAGLDDGTMSACAGRIGRYRVKTPEAYSREQLQVVAHLYYRERLDQRRIAGLLNLSQAKVSRMLTVAAERGIVRFYVAECEPRDAELERRITQRFRLGSVAVIRTPDGLTADSKRQFVAYFSTPIITSLISPHTDVVVAGGRTIGELVQRLPEERERGVTVLQALGVVKSKLAHVDALELGRVLAQRWGGLFLPMEMPAVMPDKWTRDFLLKGSTARSVWQRIGRVNSAIVAVGTPTDSVFANHYVVSPDDQAVLSRCGAVGEMCGRFFDRKGRECDSPWRDRVMSVELDRLKALPEVIALVVGRGRSAALAAAIRGGLLKSLVIDVEGALALLENTPSRPVHTTAKKKK